MTTQPGSVGNPGSGDAAPTVANPGGSSAAPEQQTGTPPAQTASTGTPATGATGTPPADKGAAPAGDPGSDVLGQPDPNAKPQTQSQPPATFPEDWRAQLAGGDEKKQKILDRYASPKAVADALLQLQEKMSKGDFKRPLDKNATPEQKAEWFKENGIPEDASGYATADLDYVIGDAEKPLIENFASAMHSLEEPLTSKQWKGVMNYYYSLKEMEQAAIAQQDNERHGSVVQSLKSEWGNDYQPNLNVIAAWMDTFMTPQQKDMMLNARLADGTKLRHSPDMLRAFVERGRAENPTATITGHTGERGVNALNDQIAAMEKFMKENRAEYFKDAAKQAEYGRLLEARERVNAQGGRAA